jgi:hypothetical protein
VSLCVFSCAASHTNLIWRAGKGSRRILLVPLKKSASEGNRFQYNQEGVKQAKKLGFVHYEGFQIQKVYTENVIEILVND